MLTLALSPECVEGADSPRPQVEVNQPPQHTRSDNAVGDTVVCIFCFYIRLTLLDLFAWNFVSKSIWNEWNKIYHFLMQLSTPGPFVFFRDYFFSWGGQGGAKRIGQSRSRISVTCAFFPRVTSSSFIQISAIHIFATSWFLLLRFVFINVLINIMPRWIPKVSTIIFYVKLVTFL